jgi:hypothetical protein
LKPQYELVFVGGIGRPYKRCHKDWVEALMEAEMRLCELDFFADPGESWAGHPAIIYGPGLPADGRTIT